MTKGLVKFNQPPPLLPQKNQAPFQKQNQRQGHFQAELRIVYPIYGHIVLEATSISPIGKNIFLQIPLFKMQHKRMFADGQCQSK